MDIGIASILKVNHAGEFAAIEIYKTQIFFSKLFYPELTQFLTETLQHERIHCKTFREMMKTREAKPCRVAFFWARGRLHTWNHHGHDG